MTTTRPTTYVLSVSFDAETCWSARYTFLNRHHALRAAHRLIDKWSDKDCRFKCIQVYTEATDGRQGTELLTWKWSLKDAKMDEQLARCTYYKRNYGWTIRLCDESCVAIA